MINVRPARTDKYLFANGLDENGEYLNVGAEGYLRAVLEIIAIDHLTHRRSNRININV